MPTARSPDHYDEYLLTGPRGRAIRVLDVGVEEVVASNRAACMPLAFAESLAAVQIGSAPTGRDASARRSSTSRMRPRDFADFVRRHASEWAKRTTSP